MNRIVNAAVVYMIVLRLRDAKSVIRSQREGDVVAEIGGAEIDSSPDISGGGSGELEEERRRRVFVKR